MTEKLKCISFPTNVRSPRIIREYLKVLIKYNFPKYDPDFEKEFIIALSREGAYGGNLDKLNETSKRTQGRVRYGYLKSFGFAYEDEGRNIIITPAGRAFADDSRDPHSVWLDQMVKWQIPNPHLDVRSGYGDFAIHPFITVLNILTKVGRLSKEEIGLFILTMKKNQDVPNTIARIRNYRDLENSEKEKFATDIASTYRVKTSTFINDYPRSAINYFVYTGILKYTDELTIAEGAESIVDRIVKEPPVFREIYPATAFYEYFGSTIGYDEDEELMNLLDAHDQVVYMLKRVTEIRGLETFTHFKKKSNRLISNPIEISYGGRTGKIDFAAKKEDLGMYTFEVHDRGSILSALNKLIESLYVYDALPFLVVMDETSRKVANEARDAHRAPGAKAIRILTKEQVEDLFQEAKNFEETRKRFSLTKIRFDQAVRRLEIT